MGRAKFCTCLVLSACLVLALFRISAASHAITTPAATADVDAADARVETWSWSVQYGLLTSPAYSAAADALYVMSKLGTLWAISMRTGKPLWRYRSFIVFPSNQAAQPLVFSGLPTAACQDTVFIGGMHALDACSGALQWHTAVAGSNYSSPSAAMFRTRGDATKPPHGMLFVNAKEKYGTSFLRYVHAEKGSVALSQPLLGSRASPPAVSTAVAGGVVCVCTSPDLAHTGGFDTPDMKDGVLHAFSATTGKSLWQWKSKHQTAFLSAPAMFAGSEALPGARVLVAHQNADNEFGVSALGAATGQLLWTFPLRERVAASPAVDADSGIVFYGTLGGTLGALDGAGMSLWTLQLNAAMHASPTLGRGNGKIYAGTTAGTVYCVDRVAGQIVWMYEAAASIVAPVLLVYANNTLIISTSVGSVVRLEADYLGATHAPTAAPSSSSVGAGTNEDDDSTDGGKKVKNPNKKDKALVNDPASGDEDEIVNADQGVAEGEEGADPADDGEGEEREKIEDEEEHDDEIPPTDTEVEEEAEYSWVIAASVGLCVAIAVVVWYRVAPGCAFASCRSTFCHWSDRIGRLITGLRGLAGGQADSATSSSSSRRLDLVPLMHAGGGASAPRRAAAATRAGEGPNPFDRTDEDADAYADADLAVVGRL